MMIKEERKMITPSDLKEGQVKVVVYSYKGCYIIVPDPSWNMKGDLSKLPQNVQNVLASPNKNHVNISQAIIDDKSQSLVIPSGRRSISDIETNGFSVVSNIVIMSGETDSHGNTIQ